MMGGGGRDPVPAKQLEQREPTITTIIYHVKKGEGAMGVVNVIAINI